MLKNTHVLMLLMVLVVFTGCETIHGMGQDIQNIPNPDKNGWNTLENADAWMRENLW